MPNRTHNLVNVPEPDIKLAEDLFDILKRKTADKAGVTRAAYGSGEQIAHNLIINEAQKIGLMSRVDAGGNLYITLPGRGPNPKKIIIGSHLDSVPMGGNFDGAAGVLSGLAVIMAWKKAGYQLSDDLVVMATRAEESNWFPHSYIGSKSALGLLPAYALDIKRSDTGRSLADHMIDLGLEPERIRIGEPQINKADIRAYIELHIEQGPILIQEMQPTALVTGIRGSFRYRDVHIIGEYAHSGAVPRLHRHDAVIGAADLILKMQEEWLRLEENGNDLVFTVGILTTDPAQHAFSKISGDVHLSIDVRSHQISTLDQMHEKLLFFANQVSQKQRVTINLGTRTGSTPAVMDQKLIDTFSLAMEQLGLKPIEMACGAGHDAAVFAGEGIPSLMIFIRNENGSHNPNEAMDIEDFAAATRLLAQGLALID